jgi:S-(hydroxymethyl)mycothiol dehydrogenase
MPAAAAGGAVIGVEAAGLCRSDWHGWQGHDRDIPSLPHTPGHEFAGVVHAVGEGVRRVRVGDRVVVPFICGCGECTWCVSGSAQVCPNQWQPGFHGPGCYAEFAAIPWADFNLVALPDGLPFDVAASLGCRFATAYRGIVDVAGVSAGEWVAVFGCGGVGLNTIQAARLVGAGKIIAVDVMKQKLAWAEEFGATHTINSSETDPVEAIRALTGGNGADVCVEAVGRPEVLEQAFYARDLAGTVVQVGVPDPSMKIELPMIEFFGRGGALKPSWYGDCLPSRDFPMLIDLYLSGRLDLDRFVSETISLDAVEDAFHKMERGEVLRSVVVL